MPKQQLGSESFCQTGPPFVPVISRNKEDRDTDIYDEMDIRNRRRYGEADQAVSPGTMKGSEVRETKKGSEKGVKDTKPEDLNKTDTNNSLVQVLTSKLTVKELRNALLAAEQEETRQTVKSIMPQDSKEEETVCEQPRVCDNTKDVRVYITIL